MPLLPILKWCNALIFGQRPYSETATCLCGVDVGQEVRTSTSAQCLQMWMYKSHRCANSMSLDGHLAACLTSPPSTLERARRGSGHRRQHVCQTLCHLTRQLCAPCIQVLMTRAARERLQAPATCSSSGNSRVQRLTAQLSLCAVTCRC